MSLALSLSPELKYVTPERLQEWKSSTPSSASASDPPVPMTRFLYELCWAMIHGELPFQKCKAALDSVHFEENPYGDEMGSILADIVAQFAQDLTISGDHRARLVKMTKVLVEGSLVPARLLQERCEEEFLFESGLSKLKAQDLKSREVRVNTRLLYQQTKFNLLREESEGYAKLVTLLCQGCLESTSNNSLGVTISIIKSLIGHFDLDPNRVFDIVLDCFELYPEKKIFHDLIPIFPKSHAAQILGFKFQYYQRMEVTASVPSSLFYLAALLVKENFVDLDSIYPHLLPQDEDAFTHYEGFLSKKIEEANKIGKINLAATGKDLMEAEEKQDVSVDFYAVWDLELDVLTERAPEIATNQKLGLLIGFLSVHDWYHSHVLFERLSPMNPVEHVEICKGLFSVIEKTMSNAYATVSKSYQEASGKFGNSDDVIEVDSPANSSSSVDLPKDFFQMLSIVGPYLHRDTVLLQKVCRVLKGYYMSTRDDAARSNSSEPSDESRRYKEARLRVEDAVGSCILPSLQLIPANPAIGYEIWDVLSLLPYEVRYRLYGEWEKDDERNPLVLSARQLAKLDTRRILKRLAKENLKQLGRMVAKLAHGNPMTVLRTIVQQIEAYRDMITPVVDAFKYLTQLEYDILEYVVIERLAQGGRDKLKEDGLNLADWLQSLASFWGSLCKKYPSMELRGLFQYLINQLKKGSGTELVLLEELIEQMANVHYTENITEEQLDALAGSETLRFQSTLYGSTRNNKVLSKSTSRLRDSLTKDDPKLAIPLLMLIAQYRSMVIIKANAPYIKMVSEQFDRCHATLLQYVDFLCSAISPVTAYAQLIPSLHDLSHKYHLDPEVAFLIYRPVMRLFKSRGSEGVCWPLDTGEEVDSEKGFSDFVLHLDLSQAPVRWSELLTTVESMLPPKSWKSLSPDLYATFWGLTLYDLHVPKKRYEAEIAKQHSALKALEELSDTSSFAISKRKKDKEKIQELLDRLSSEYRKHEKHVESVRKRMALEKDRWLSQCPEPVKTNMEFLQHCVFPRSIFSATDAAFCAAFVRMLHTLGTPYFNTFQHIELLICKFLQPMICCCTELEAGRFGRFLCETLRMAYDWKKDESLYERECANMPGFAVYYRDPNSQRVSFAQFVRVHFKWSQRITRVLVLCLESTEYMDVRNALIVLTKISSVFPVLRKSGVNLEKRVSKIKADEREDLKVLATGVAATLASRKSSWLSDEDFGMGYMETRPAASPAKAPAGNSNHNKAVDSGNNNNPKEHTARHKSTTDAKIDRSNGEHAKTQPEEISSKASRSSADSEMRAQKQRGAPSILGKPPKLEDSKSNKISLENSRPDSTPATATNGKSSSSQRGTNNTSSTSSHATKTESSTQKRSVQNDEQERLSKRRKGDERERETTENEKEREREREKENDRSSRDDRHEKEPPREREKQREREKERERSTERRERDRSLERGGGGKEEREREREREKLPPPPPLPPSFVPQSVSRHSVERERERERERDEDGGKRRREEDNRDGRKRDDRDSSSSKIEEREREKEKLKEESDANAKRRKVKRSVSTEPGEYSPAIPSSHSYDTKGERKGAGTTHRGGHGDDNARTHSKDASSKTNRRDTEQDRDWEEDKRQRADAKRKHRK